MEKRTVKGAKAAKAKAKKPISKVVVEPVIEKPIEEVIVEAKEDTTFLGQDDLQMLLGSDFDEVVSLMKKFQNRYGVKLQYIHKFRAFKLLRGVQHVDWITLNDLMKRYDCRIAPLKMNSHPQRPFERARVY